MTNFDHLMRIIEGIYNIELKMLGATMEQVRGAQACWIAALRWMNELMGPFVIFQAGFAKEEKQGAAARTTDRELPIQEKVSPVPITTVPVAERFSRGSDRGATKDQKRDEPMITRDIVTRGRPGKRVKVSVPVVEVSSPPVVTESAPALVTPAVQGVVSRSEPSGKPAPAGRTRPVSAKGSARPSGMNRSLDLKRFSKIRATGKKLRTRGG